MWEEKNLKKKILVLLVGMALLVGILSGCTEETTPTNTAPTASFTISAAGLTITFDASGSADEDGDDLTYVWDFGDDSDAGSGVNPSHEYTASGAYTVSLTVNDGTVDSDAYTMDITVTNPPTVTLGDLPETITNATEITFTATAVAGDAEINETTGYAWYIDDVVQEGETTATFLHTFSEDGTYVVKVVVTDEDALTGEATVTVTVPTEPEE